MKHTFKSWALCWHISEMRMRHDSWHQASISSPSASRGAAKIRARKTLLVLTPANRCRTGCCTRRRKSRGGGKEMRWMPTQRPNPRRGRIVHFKKQGMGKGTMVLLTSWAPHILTPSDLLGEMQRGHYLTCELSVHDVLSNVELV